MDRSTTSLSGRMFVKSGAQQSFARFPALAILNKSATKAGKASFLTTSHAVNESCYRDQMIPGADILFFLNLINVIVVVTVIFDEVGVGIFI